MWPSIHSIALCRCGGHICMVGKSNHVNGTCRGSVRSMRAILKRVQLHMSCAVSHDITLCIMVSVCPHFIHLGVSLRRMVWRRTFVGMISCTALNHALLTSDVRCLWLMFRHIRSHRCAGCLHSIRGARFRISGMSNVVCVSYIRALNDRCVSSTVFCRI